MMTHPLSVPAHPTLYFLTSPLLLFYKIDKTHFPWVYRRVTNPPVMLAEHSKASGSWLTYKPFQCSLNIPPAIN